MTQLPLQLTIPGLNGLPFDAVRAPCKTLYRTTDGAPCCGDCFLFKAVRCNTILCGPTVPSEIFVCKDGECQCSQYFPHCEPCGRPYEDGMLVRYGGYCYKIQTGTVYCPQISARTVRRLSGSSGSLPPGTDCEPLPQGAIVPPGLFVDCCKDCTPINGCREIDGWFPALLCPCPNNGTLNCVVYVSCRAYFNAVGGNSSACPTWLVICQQGGAACVYVRPDAIPVPDLPPNAIGVDSDASSYRSCCECCTHAAAGCCYELFSPKTTKWHNSAASNNPPVVVEGLPQACCRVRDQTTYSGSATVETWFRWPDGHRCVTTRLVSKVVNVAGVWKVEYSLYRFDVGGSSTDCPTQNPNFQHGLLDIPPCTNAAQLLQMLTGTDVGGGEPGGVGFNGELVQTCSNATVQGDDFGNTTTSEHRFAGVAQVSSAEGCGNVNCQPGGGLLRGGPNPPGDCSGCGSPTAATKF